MVRSIEGYKRKLQQERVADLRSLTYRRSAKRLEELLRSCFVFELHFSDDDHPVGLAWIARRRNRGKKLRLLAECRRGRFSGLCEAGSMGSDSIHRKDRVGEDASLLICRRGCGRVKRVLR